MAQGILQSLDPHLDVHSAGTKPASEVHPLGIKVMSEIGIDISTHYPKHIDRFIDQDWDFVITVCGGANESCPMFSGKVGKRMHIGFDDPEKDKKSRHYSSVLIALRCTDHECDIETVSGPCASV